MDNADSTNYTFTVLAELRGYPKPIAMTGLSFARLMDEVVLPYQENQAFFVDGVPATRNEIQRLKIVREGKELEGLLAELHWSLRAAQPAEQETRQNVSDAP